MNNFQIQQYLERIGYVGPVTPNLSVLKGLQRRHLFNVPFENLDIHSGRSIILDRERLFRKIVQRKRGGFCYELNGLFYYLLKGLGFQVRRISASVYGQTKGFGPPYDHLVIICTIDNQEYLVDVGYGRFAFGPLRVTLGVLQEDERGAFSISAIPDNMLLVTRHSNSGDVIEYRFENVHRGFTEFEATCHYHQTDADSHFTQSRVITRPTDDGRITLTDKSLKITSNGEVDVREFSDSAVFDQLLHEHFGF